MHRRVGCDGEAYRAVVAVPMTVGRNTLRYSDLRTPKPQKCALHHIPWPGFDLFLTQIPAEEYVS